MKILNIFKQVKFIEYNGIYKAIEYMINGEKIWYLPSKNIKQYFWIKNFMKNHERYIDSLKKNDIVIEIGATTGEYTVVAAKKIGEGKIYAFEVRESNYKCLKRNTEKKKNVICINKAISNKINLSEFIYSKEGLAEGTF